MKPTTHLLPILTTIQGCSFLHKEFGKMASRKVLQSLRKYSGGPSGSATTTSSPRRQQDELPDRGSDERPPPSSRSVEPPQIRQFQYSESPGPMITTPSPPVMVSELPTISETTPRILPRRDLAGRRDYVCKSM